MHDGTTPSNSNQGETIVPELRYPSDKLTNAAHAIDV